MHWFDKLDSFEQESVMDLLRESGNRQDVHELTRYMAVTMLYDALIKRHKKIMQGQITHCFSPERLEHIRQRFLTPDGSGPLNHRDHESRQRDPGQEFGLALYREAFTAPLALANWLL